MKKIFTLVLVLLMFGCLNTITFAAIIQENETVTVGDIIHSKTGDDVIIKINSDRTFYTVPLSNLLEKAGPSCSHTSIKGYGNKYTESVSYNKKNATYCYKTRTWQKGSCLKCNKKDFKIYGEWKSHKHSYPFLGKTCKECSYKKK